MALKYSYYVGIFNDNGLMTFVTDVDCATKSAKWRNGFPALEFSLTGAKELQYGLLCNGYEAAVVIVPPYMCFVNK